MNLFDLIWILKRFYGKIDYFIYFNKYKDNL